MLRELKLWTKKDGEDVDLGPAYCEDIPRQGDLLSHGTEHGNTWRVLFAYRHLIQYGSPGWITWRAGRYTDPIWVDIFVEPADGPFE